MIRQKQDIDLRLKALELQSWLAVEKDLPSSPAMSRGAQSKRGELCER
jgi:hypothetical protein